MNSTLSAPHPLERNVTLRDIAEFVGVSVQSVSGVLNGGETPKRVSPQTRQRILAAAEELGYRRNHSARATRTGNTRMLGWIGGDLKEEHVGKMLTGALEAAESHGYTLKILRSGDLGDAQNAIRRGSELRLMGVIGLHLSVSTQRKLYDEATRFGYPLVLMDERSDKADIPQVVSDDEGGIRQGVEHLVKLGHRRIAFISAEEDPTIISRSRERAFAAAMSHFDLDVAPGSIVHGSFSVREPSLRAARALLALPPEQRPTAIFCSGDFIALATLQVAQECNIAVPGQLSIVGFANMGFLDFITPRLTTIEQPFYEIGRQSVHILLEVVEARAAAEAQEADSALRDLPGDSAPPYQTVLKLPTHLIRGASTAPPQTTA